MSNYDDRDPIGAMGRRCPRVEFGCACPRVLIVSGTSWCVKRPHVDGSSAWGEAPTEVTAREIGAFALKALEVAK